METPRKIANVLWDVEPGTIVYLVMVDKSVEACFRSCKYAYVEKAALGDKARVERATVDADGNFVPFGIVFA